MSKLPNDFVKTAKMCGLSHLLNQRGHFYVEKNKVLSYDAPKGITMRAIETAGGVDAHVIVEKGVKIKEPLFFCFGLKGKRDHQFVIPNVVVGEGAEVSIFAHCSFPHAVKIQHDMEGRFEIGKNAKLTYEEHHYHGTRSGALVVPKLNLHLGQGAEFVSFFNLTKGTVGKVHIEVEAWLEKNARMYVESKVMGKNANDNITIVDKVHLNGENAKSLLKMRAAARDGGTVLMQGETYANAAGAVGHVDCQEIVVGKGSVARAVPIVEVSDENARVTHEASVGKINQKELETLMTRGLSEDEATEMIVEAMMR